MSLASPSHMDLSLQSRAGGVDPVMLGGQLLEATGLPLLPPDFSVEARKLMDNLSLLKPPGSGTAFGLTASCHGEGVSTLACSSVLAFGVVNAGPVLFVDANPVSPLHFSRQGHPGLSDLLLGRCDTSDAIRRLERSRVSLLGVGESALEMTTQPNDERIARTMQELRAHFPVIVFDLAPPVDCPFSNRLARVLDGVALVVQAHNTDRHQVELAVMSMRRAQVPLLGVVYNRRQYEA